jgi:uncharacterized protein (DUF1778 family)
MITVTPATFCTWTTCCLGGPIRSPLTKQVVGEGAVVVVVEGAVVLVVVALVVVVVVGGGLPTCDASISVASAVSLDRPTPVQLLGAVHETAARPPSRVGLLFGRNLRVDAGLQVGLRAAAEANGESLTGFVLAAAAVRAEEVLRRTGRIVVSTDAFERFIAALDDPAEAMPTLSRYSTKPNPILPG